MNLAAFILRVESMNANLDLALLRRAYEFSDKAHAGQTRQSGEPFIEHCLEVASILAEQHLDSTTVAAGIIHDVVEDTKFTLDDIRREFGDEVAELVDGVTKIGAVKFASYEEQQIEYFRKMLLSMAKDVRVILIKLADRLHNMRTLYHLPREKQLRIAKETREVYSPLAHRLGINKTKTELEDLCLKYLEPEIYKELAARVEEKLEERESYIAETVEPIKEALVHDNIQAAVYGRAKHLDSIHRKTRVRLVPFEEIFDLFAIRVIVNSERECYHAMGIIHAMWKPVAGRFHDYIANPKPNGYRSLHTTVIGPRNKMVEIQIRTHQMHYVAENGIAAHWLYKEGRQQLSKDDRQLIWLRDALEWQKDMTNPSEFIEYLRMDLYSEDIFVYTPKGKLVHLPRGSTPLDFAFLIHTQVGLHTAGAKINGRIQPLSTQLKSGDSVEILTNPNRSPSHDWLKIARTSNARTRIKRWLKQAGFEQSVTLGRQLLERRLRDVRVSMPDESSMQDAAEKLGRKSVQDLLAGLGNGSVPLQRVVDLFHIEADDSAPIPMVGQVLDRIRRAKGIRVQGMENMMFRFAGCCQPVPGEEIIGFITRGRGVTIHRADCNVANEIGVQHPERKIAVSWDVGRDQSVVVQLEVIVEDRKGMLSDLTAAITDSNTNVKGAEVNTQDGTAAGYFIVEVANLSHLNRVIDKMKKVKGVISVRRSHRREKEKDSFD